MKRLESVSGEQFLSMVTGMSRCIVSMEWMQDAAQMRYCELVRLLKPVGSVGQTGRRATITSLELEGMFPSKSSMAVLGRISCQREQLS